MFSPKPPAIVLLIWLEWLIPFKLLVLLKWSILLKLLILLELLVLHLLLILLRVLLKLSNTISSHFMSPEASLIVKMTGNDTILDKSEHV